MKESISYTFLLNIIIVFIFVCFAIVMGIFSYYRAFRANTIISQAIEKYEGYNCASKQEIAQKLNNISYNTPFNVKCNEKEQPCLADENQGYKVISYNLDKLDGELHYINNFEMGSPVGVTDTKKTPTKNYQYGIYTYMYVDLPVVASILKIPFFATTDVMYEFRDLNYLESTNTVYDERTIPEAYKYNISRLSIDYAFELQNMFSDLVNGKEVSILNIDSKGYEARTRAKVDINDNLTIDDMDFAKGFSAYTGIYYNEDINDFKNCNVLKYENY